MSRFKTYNTPGKPKTVKLRFSVEAASHPMDSDLTIALRKIWQRVGMRLQPWDFNSVVFNLVLWQFADIAIEGNAAINLVSTGKPPSLYVQSFE